MTHRAARPFGSFGSLVAGSVAGPPAASRRRTPAGSRLPGLVAGLLAVAVLTAAGCTSTGSERAGVGAFQDPLVPAGEFRLVAYNSCEEAAEQLRAATREYVSPWGLGGDMLAVEDGAAAAGDGRAAPERAMAPEQAAVPAPAGAAAPAREPAPDPAVDPAAPQHSGTNVHEAGVDEPDLVKTDGRRIVTVNRGVLRVVDAATRTETGRLELAPAGGSAEFAELALVQASDLLLYGDRALVLLRESYGALAPVLDLPEVQPALPGDQPEGPAVTETTASPEPAPVIGPTMLLIDLTSNPRVLSEYTMDGSLVDARAVGGTARVVVRSTPRLEFPNLPPDTDPQERLEQNRAVVDAAELSAWLPRYQVTTGGDTTIGQVDCTAMSRPASYTGTSMVTVLTFDLAAPALGDGAPVSVVADGETVYSNGSSLYLAHDMRWQLDVAAWIDPENPVAEPGGPARVAPDVNDQTEIHKFDTSQPGPPRYVGSGVVDGWLINQYAMSEWDGHLRVATTSGESWARQSGESESTVYVLAEHDGVLTEVGSVGGLGKGEHIYAVRFAGPVGYVVTFRQTDPLYTVDLSDPTAPRVAGELKITGYSAYLHPIGGGLLVGVGQEADEQGRVLGTQVSLFDVSNLAEPRRVAQYHIEYGHSEAEFDPHAFLWWSPQSLLVIPMTGFTGDSGAVLVRLDPGTGPDRSGAALTEVATISHPTDPDWLFANQVRRSLVIGDVLWTVSDVGLAAHRLADQERLAWLPY